MRSRRRFTSLLATLLALVTTAGAGCRNSPTAPSSEPVVVAFGDSITFGVGTNGGNDYVSRLSNRTGVRIVNDGWPGDTTGSALARIDTVLSRDPQIVMVLLGGNDILQNVPVPQRVSNLTTIVQRLRAGGAEVILVGLGSGFLDPFDGALPDLAAQTSSTLVDGVLEGVFGVPSLMADAIHPNNAGHAIIADRIAPALRAVLAAVGSQAGVADRSPPRSFRLRERSGSLSA